MVPRLGSWLIAGFLLTAATPASAQFWGFDLPRPGRSLTRAQPTVHPESNVPHPAIVRVVVDERSSISHGSGVLVATQDSTGLVLTNWHVVRDVAGPINVVFPSGFMSPAKIVKVDKDWDLAALSIWNPQTHPLPIAKSAPHVGDELTIAGYGAGQFRAITGRCSQFLSPGARFPYEMVEINVEARRGDSGGPILNHRGEVAGILFGAGTGTTSGSHSGRVRRFLAPWIAVVDQPPAALASQTAPPALAGAAPTLPARPEVPTAPAQPPAAPLPVAATSNQPPQTPAVVEASSITAARRLPPAESLVPVELPAEVPPAHNPPVASHTAGYGARATLPPESTLTSPITQSNSSSKPFSSISLSGSPLEHARNVLAIVGLTAVVFHLFRRPSE